MNNKNIITTCGKLNATNWHHCFISDFFWTKMIFKGLKMWLFQFTIEDDPSPNLGSKLQCPSQVCVSPSFSHSMPFFLYLIGPSFYNFLFIQIFVIYPSLCKIFQVSLQRCPTFLPSLSHTKTQTIDNNW